MALSMHTAALSFAGNVAPLARRTGAVSMETIEDLKAVRMTPIARSYMPLHVPLRDAL